MAQVALPVRRRWGQTSRRDSWWSQPLTVFLVLSAFLVYANVRVFEGDHYFSGHAPQPARYISNYLTPFYSPLMYDAPARAAQSGPSGHAWLGAKPAWIPSFVSAAALILIFPAGFRFTCYYYRGAYYKAFWQDPPSCAVGEPRNEYRGEAKWPLLIQNIHRYFMYFAVVFLFILGYDAWHAFWFKEALPAGEAKWHFGVGVGSLVLLLNVVLLTGYTLGCHSLRHLVGGSFDEVSKMPLREKMYCGVTCLNGKHMLWAWLSLVWVAFSDVYVRMVASGAWTDVHFVF
ncbi:MAG: succinate dehydrogenase [Phycisphaerae bacterium]